MLPMFSQLIISFGLKHQETFSEFRDRKTLKVWFLLNVNYQNFLANNIINYVTTLNSDVTWKEKQTYFPTFVVFNVINEVFVYIMNNECRACAVEKAEIPRLLLFS